MLNNICERLAAELGLYASGRAIRCHHCGAVYTLDAVEEYENGDGWTAHKCPECGDEIDATYREDVTLCDYLEDYLDLEYRIGADRTYRSASIMIACGKPNIYIDTKRGALCTEDREIYPLRSELITAIDEWAEDHCNQIL